MSDFQGARFCRASCLGASEGVRLKSVACHFVSRFCPDSHLLVWAGALEYKGVQSFSSGAKAGLGEEDLVVAAILDILLHLKESVAIRLIASPEINDDVFEMLTLTRLDLRFSREAGRPLEELESHLSGARQFAFAVLAQQREMSVLGASVDGLGAADEWISVQSLDGSEHKLDCHLSLFFQHEKPIETQESLCFD